MQINLGDAYWVECTITDVKDIVLLVVSICTVLISLHTAKKWKTEYKGKAYFDAAIKFKVALYNLRTNFGALRVGLILPHEFPPEDVTKRRDREIYVLNNRYKVFNEALGEFYKIRPEMEAYFGKTAKEVCDKINGVLTQYNIARNTYLQMIDNTNNLEALGEEKKKVYNSGSDDELSYSFEIEIKNAEYFLEKYTNFKN